MAITPSSLTNRLNSSLEGLSLGGVSKPKLALAIATAFTQFLRTVVVSTTHVGIVGTGSGTGKVTARSSSGVGMVTTTLAAQGVRGVSAAQIAQGIVTGIAREVNSNAIVQVVIAGTSTGSGRGSLSKVEGTVFTQLLLTAFKANGIDGVMAAQLASGIGSGVANWLRTASVSTVDTGTPVPPFNSSSGTGLGTIS